MSSKRPPLVLAKFESESSPGTTYGVVLRDDDSLSCSCKGFYFSREAKTCKHIRSESVQDALCQRVGPITGPAKVWHTFTVDSFGHATIHLRDFVATRRAGALDFDEKFVVVASSELTRMTSALASLTRTVTRLTKERT